MLLGGPVIAQQAYTITGRVVDASGAAPVQGAQVSLTGTGAGGLTNNTGTYTITAEVAPGEYTVEASFIGRETVTTTIQLGTDRTVNVPDLALRERPLELEAVIVTGTAAPTARRA